MPFVCGVLLVGFSIDFLDGNITVMTWTCFNIALIFATILQLSKIIAIHPNTDFIEKHAHREHERVGCKASFCVECWLNKTNMTVTFRYINNVLQEDSTGPTLGQKNTKYPKNVRYWVSPK